ncbi:hypothetical protein BVRB_6g139960 [Beta vulgaris subsp. vulgaris]|nr:hypothetical protein BVRB_6g139960 [Beta vulgaris subsp. vulgaris]
MGFDAMKLEKLKNKMIAQSRIARTKMWMIRLMSMVLIWSCAMQLITFNKKWEPKVFSCLSSADKSSSEIQNRRLYENNGFLMVSTNGGLNQMRAGICDMVTIARYLNITLIVPELDKISFWKDQSEFHDIFDVHYFINSLRDEVQILRELPSNMKKEMDSGKVFSMAPISWSDMTYYYDTVLPGIKKQKVVHFNKSDCRLANNGLPIDVQKFRCRVNYQSLKFTPAIEKLGKRIIDILKRNGPFLALHLRYEMDMLAFSGCIQGCDARQVKELTAMRYAYPWWKEKVINATEKRNRGECPLTPEETSLTLKALGIDGNIQVYIAAGHIYGGESRLAPLAAYFPNLVKKETLLQISELSPFMNHSSQMAALDYMVSLESDIFVATYGGNMAKVVEGHRRYLGYRKTINLDRQVLVKLIDQYKNGSLCWDELSRNVKLVHRHRMGTPKKRLQVPEKPKLEDYFYANPEECLP